MDPFFAWVEHSGLSVWIRESESILAFPGIVVLHTLGMGLLVGANAAIDLRILGVARQIPLAAMTRFAPVMWTGLALNVFSGVLLLIAYPTKAFTNPWFYVKLTGVALSVWVLCRVLRHALHDDTSKSARRLAAASLLLWTITITGGRLLAYTYTRLFADS